MQAPNLIKDLNLTSPGQVLVSDITYLRPRNSRFAYLFLTTDLYSRMIVGYHVSLDLSHHSALLALMMAVERAGSLEGAIITLIVEASIAVASLGRLFQATGCNQV